MFPYEFHMRIDEWIPSKIDDFQWVLKSSMISKWMINNGQLMKAENFSYNYSWILLDFQPSFFWTQKPGDSNGKKHMTKLGNF